MNALEKARSHPRYLALSDCERARVDRWNEMVGSASDDCPLCHGRRHVFITTMCVRDCDCKERHANMRRVESSGLTDQLKRMTFDNFSTVHPWQKEIKLAARKFAKNPDGAWFYIGGQVGAGKTHICSAILAEMMNAGSRARYMVWPDEADKIKGNAEGFAGELERLMEIDVLYIDDFLKTAKEERRAQNGYITQKKPPTTGELNAAFKLINNRYNDGNKITVISSELFLDDVMAYDAGLGSRIYHRCKAYRLEIANEREKNMRLAE